MLFRSTEDVVAEVVSQHKAVVRVPAKDIPAIIGKQGQNIDKIEDKLGINIDVQELEHATGGQGKKKEVQYEIKVKSKSINFFLSSLRISVIFA